MSSISFVSEPLAEVERNARIYAGEILVFRQPAAVTRLVKQLAALVCRLLGDDPERAHLRMREADVADAIQALRKSVQDDSEIREQIKRMFAAVGMHAGDNYDDGLKLRAQLPHSESGLRGVAPLSAHRDTWGSNVMAQTNWWAPVFPITPERTIALFPAWFERPVTNDSTGWDFAEMVRRIKQEGYYSDYPLLPTATHPPAWHDALAISIEPGDLMAFSGAHLHASVPNTTDRTRFSFEIRTVNATDATAGRGAPNVDGKAVRTTWQMFRRLTDRRKLGDMA